MHLLSYYLLYSVFHGLSWKQYDQLDQTLDALCAGIRYLDGHHQALELQDIMATRMVYDQLSVISRRIVYGSTRVSYDIWTRLRSIKRQADTVVTKALPYLYSNYRDVGNFRDLTKKNYWIQNYDMESLDFTLLDTDKSDNSSKDTDNCLTELLGTKALRHVNHTECGLSENCWINMTKPGLKGFNLTAQVFYFMAGESTGCFSGLFKEYTHRYVNKFCSNMIMESIKIEKEGYLTEKLGLFFQQQAYCLMNGFYQFASDSWLGVILNSQLKEQGCWGIHNSTADNITEPALTSGDSNTTNPEQLTGHYNITNQNLTTSDNNGTILDVANNNGTILNVVTHPGPGQQTTTPSAADTQPPQITEESRRITEGACDTRLTSKAVITLTQYIRYIVKYL